MDGRNASAERLSQAAPMKDRTWIIATAPITGMIAVVFMGSTLLTPLYALYRKSFGFSEIILTLIYAAYVIGNLAAFLFFGRLSDRIGRRRTAVPALWLSVGATLLFLFAGGTAWLFAGRILSGFAIGLTASSGTAWLAEADGDKAHAAMLATMGNFAGLAAGPLIAGFLAQYAPWPQQLPYVLYLTLLGLTLLLVARVRETVARPADSLTGLSFAPRLGIPAGIRVQFISPAATAFATFAFIGFYAALAPTLIADSLHERNAAVGGAVVAELFLIAMLSVAVTAKWTSRTAMLGGLALLLPSLALLVLAQADASMPLLLAGTALSGVAAALGYRGSLQVVNEVTPQDRRSEVVSAYMVVCFFGNSLPVIGVGVLSAAATQVTALRTFTLVTGLIAVAALVTGWKYIAEREGSG